MKTVTKNDRLRKFGRATTLALVAGAPLIGALAPADAQLGGPGYRRDQEPYQTGRIREDISLTGVVTSDLPGDQFDFRADNGRTYRVVFPRRENEPRRISRGDQIVVEGNLDRDILVARDVRILDNRGPGGGPGGGQVDRNFTATGIVTSDLPGDQFDVRADNGRTYRVVFHRNETEPRRISRGDRVEVSGHLDRDILIAHDVRILDNRGPGGGQIGRFTTTGIVISDLPGDQFDVRADNGRVYRVVFRRNDNEPRRLSRNDRVEITGRLDRDILIADDVRILDNRGGNDWNDRRTLTGVVTRDFSGDNFEMRVEEVGSGRILSSGRIVRVDARGDEPRRLSRGDRVTVFGRFSANDRDRFVAETVRLLDDGGNVGRRTLSGVVIRDLVGDNFEMRGDNGRVFRVRGRNEEPRRLSRGDRVTVFGRFSDAREDLFIAQSVRLTGNGGIDNYPSGSRRVDFNGRVLDVLPSRTRLIVRGDNGRSYTVNATERMSSSIGRDDRVRVTGISEGGDTVLAARVVLVDNDYYSRGDARGDARIEDSRGDRDGDAVSFTGTVESALFGMMRVRGDNGRLYTVRSRRAGDFSRNDRVRVTGRASGGGNVVDATDIIRA